MRSGPRCGAVPAAGGQSGVPGDRGDRSGRGARRRTQRTAHDPPSSRSTFAFPRTEMNRILPLLLGAFCGWGCDNSASPPLPAVAPRPRRPHRRHRSWSASWQDRIEIREGESIPVEVRFDAVTDLRSTWLHHLTIPLRVAVEAGSASPDDGVVARRVGVLRARLRKNPAGERRLAGRPPGPGRRCLRGAGEPAAPSLRRDGPREEPPGWGAGSERPYETGDRSRDSRWSRSCSGVELTAAAPRRSRSTASRQRALYVTDVTVMSGTPGFLRVDPDLSSRIRSIRTEPHGAGFRHELPASATSCRLPP